MTNSPNNAVEWRTSTVKAYLSVLPEPLRVSALISLDRLFQEMEDEASRRMTAMWDHDCAARKIEEALPSQSGEAKR